MASDASEPKADAEDVEPTTDADPGTGADEADQASDGEPAAVKDKFLEALQRKQEQSKGKANSGNRGEAKVHEVHRSTTSKRRFRRKSG